MKYVSQLDYPHVPYNHDLARGGAAEHNRNVAKAGCGLASACMIVDHLTLHTLGIEEAVQLSESNGCSHTPGTNMRLFAPIFAEKFGLTCRGTYDKAELLAHLRAGGEAIANVNHQGEGCQQMFIVSGKHYIVVESVDENDWVCILDPQFEKMKDRYLAFEQEGRMRVSAPFIYCHADDLMTETVDCQNIYLFARKQ